MPSAGCSTFSYGGFRKWEGPSPVVVVRAHIMGTYSWAFRVGQALKEGPRLRWGHVVDVVHGEPKEKATKTVRTAVDLAEISS